MTVGYRHRREGRFKGCIIHLSTSMARYAAVSTHGYTVKKNMILDMGGCQPTDRLTKADLPCDIASMISTSELRRLIKNNPPRNWTVT